MRVRFAADVLAEPGAWSLLDGIIEKFLDERHIWDADDSDAIEQSPWITSEPGSRATRRNLEALQMIPIRALYAPPSKSHSQTLEVSLAEAPPNTLTPRDALRALETPVYIVVENGESDRAFLGAMLGAFERAELRSALDKYWCDIISAGGCGEIPKRVRELVAKIGKGPRRILILSDSDRLKPDDPAKPDDRPDTIEQLEKCRNEHGVELIILRKREIENYLPVDALQRVPKAKQKTYKAFLVLNDVQRSHYDMKKGFEQHKATKKAIVLPEQAELFSRVPLRILDGLCGGFGKEIWTYFERAADVITRDAIRATCPDDPDEIERILDAIERLL